MIFKYTFYNFNVLQIDLLTYQYLNIIDYLYCKLFHLLYLREFEYFGTVSLIFIFNHSFFFIESVLIFLTIILLSSHIHYFLNTIMTFYI